MNRRRPIRRTTKPRAVVKPPVEPPKTDRELLALLFYGVDESAMVCRLGEVLVTTLYVAGPMTGYPAFNYPAFVAASQTLRDRDYQVLNPTECGVPDGSPWEAFMRATLTMMLRADGVATLSGWECSRGARIEVELALSLGMPVRPFNQWLGRWAA